MDRIFVSKLLSLQAFGYYSLAYTAGIAISLLQLSINSATLPAYSEAASHGTGELAERYAKVSELMSFAAALPCFLLMFFGGDILKVWVSADAARGAGVPLMLLAAGFFVNAAVSNAYLAAVATRNAGIPAMVNAVGALLYAPALFALTRSFGTVGAAFGWVLLNLYYLPTLVPTVHRKVLHQPVLAWLWHGFAAPMVAGVAAVGAMKASAVALGSPVATWAAFVAAVPLYVLIGYALISPALRAALHRQGGLALVLPSGRTSAP
jgi:O-antigen/teichoic acid export membrane protein